MRARSAQALVATGASGDVPRVVARLARQLAEHATVGHRAAPRAALRLVSRHADHPLWAS